MDTASYCCLNKYLCPNWLVLLSDLITQTSSEKLNVETNNWSKWPEQVSIEWSSLNGTLIWHTYLESSEKTKENGTERLSATMGTKQHFLDWCAHELTTPVVVRTNSRQSTFQYAKENSRQLVWTINNRMTLKLNKLKRITKIWKPTHFRRTKWGGEGKGFSLG